MPVGHFSGGSQKLQHIGTALGHHSQFGQISPACCMATMRLTSRRAAAFYGSRGWNTPLQPRRCGLLRSAREALRLQ